MTFLSLKGTLIYGLSQALFSKCEEAAPYFTDFLYVDALHDGSCAEFGWSEISLSRKVRTSEILYTSALPQRILRGQKRGEEPSQSLTLLKVSEQVVEQLRNSRAKLLNNKKNHQICEQDHKAVDDFMFCQLWDGFEIETQRPGWVSFRLSEAGLNLWLIHLNERLSELINHDSEIAVKASSDSFLYDPLKDPQLWQVQYAHGRCCCLLRLWNAQIDTVYRVRNDTSLAVDDIIAGDAGGDGRDRDTPASARNSAKNQVIHKLVALLDLAESDLFWIPYRYPSEQYFLLLKAAGALSQAFEHFSAIDLSGFGKVNQLSSAAIKRDFQTKFTLLLIVKKTLKVLLERCLGVCAPTQL